MIKKLCYLFLISLFSIISLSIHESKASGTTKYLEQLKSKDFQIRLKGLSSLQRNPDLKAVSAVIETLEDTNPRVREWAVHVLMGYANKADLKKAVPKLVKIIQTDSKSVRYHTFTLLGRIRDNRAVPTLLNALTDEKNVSIAHNIMSSLVHFKDPRIPGALVKALDANHPTIRDEALKGIRHFSSIYPKELKEANLVDEVIDLLNDESDMVVKNAIVVLGLLKDKDAIPELLKILKNNRPSHKWRAAYSLSLFNHPRGIPHLIASLNISNEYEARLLIKAIGYLKSPDTFMPLAVLLFTGNDRVRKRSVEALASLNNPKARKYLLTVLKEDKVASVRASAAYYLCRFVENEAANSSASVKSKMLDTLSEAMKDKEAIVRLNVVRTLGCFNTSQAFHLLFQAMLDKNDMVKIRAVMVSRALTEKLDKLRQKKK